MLRTVVSAVLWTAAAVLTAFAPLLLHAPATRVYLIAVAPALAFAATADQMHACVWLVWVFASQTATPTWTSVLSATLAVGAAIAVAARKFAVARAANAAGLALSSTLLTQHPLTNVVRVALFAADALTARTSTTAWLAATALYAPMWLVVVQLLAVFVVEACRAA